MSSCAKLLVLPLILFYLGITNAYSVTEQQPPTIEYLYNPKQSFHSTSDAACQDSFSAETSPFVSSQQSSQNPNLYDCTFMGPSNNFTEFGQVSRISTCDTSNGYTYNPSTEFCERDACPGGVVEWYAGNAVNDLFSTADEACDAYDFSQTGWATYYFVHSEVASNGINYYCYHRSDTAQTPEADPINLINAGIVCSSAPPSSPPEVEKQPMQCDVADKNPATGNAGQSDSDYSAASASGGTPITRSKNNSLGASNVGFGAGWTANYFQTLSIDGGDVVIRQASGRSEAATCSGVGACTLDPDSKLSLEQTATGYQLTSVDNQVEVYDLVGKLLSITDAAGRTRHLPIMVMAWSIRLPITLLA